MNWIEADITEANLPPDAYDVWHDREHYIDSVRHSVRKGGHVIVATFAPDGRERCSGLEVVRFSPESLRGEFGDDFDIVDSTRETHHPPFGTEQKLIYCYCRRH